MSFPGDQREVAAWSADQERHLADADVPDHRSGGRQDRRARVERPASLASKILGKIRRALGR